MYQTMTAKQTAE